MSSIVAIRALLPPLSLVIGLLLLPRRPKFVVPVPSRQLRRADKGVEPEKRQRRQKSDDREGSSPKRPLLQDRGTLRDGSDNKGLPKTVNQHRLAAWKFLRFRMALAVWLPVPAALDAGEGAQKNFCAENPHNPLKSHDSDERIQGNPRKSNRRKAGLSRRKSFIPRKPKSIRQARRPGHIHLVTMFKNG
jgi:hypothetical protein